MPLGLDRLTANRGLPAGRSRRRAGVLFAEQSSVVRKPWMALTNHCKNRSRPDTDSRPCRRALRKTGTAISRLRHFCDLHCLRWDCIEGHQVWMPVLLAGGIPGSLYTLSLLIKNRSSSLYRQEGTKCYWLQITVMGGLWLGGIVLYGGGVTRMGILGPVVGWPVFMSGAAIASAAWGTMFGEWNNSGTTAKAAMTSGVFCLVIAIIILSKVGP
jgi:hypothetical protein